MSLHLVRHGLPSIDPTVPSTDWPLDRDHLEDIRVLRSRLPADARWFSSPEAKAQQTAELLTDGPVTIVNDLREQRRSGWMSDVDSVMTRAFAEPSLPAHDGWESLADCKVRIVGAVARIRVQHPDDDLVLVGHGTAWTVLAAEITRTTPRLDTLQAMTFPDLIVLGGQRSITST